MLKDKSHNQHGMIGDNMLKHICMFLLLLFYLILIDKSHNQHRMIGDNMLNTSACS